MEQIRFYALIIGTEILNRRRSDAHFDFLSKALLAKGHKLSGVFVIEDDPGLIVQSIAFVAAIPHAVLFSFGGIGSTPDDYTRKCAAIALRDGTLPLHKEAKAIIEKQLAKEAYPHPIRMANLPKGAKLLHNPVNNMPAFSLDDRYYFMPGFPQMSHPMVKEILKQRIPTVQNYYRHTLTAQCKESLLIEVMEQMPQEVEFSSLPKRLEKGWEVSISVASLDKKLAQESFDLYLCSLKVQNIDYAIEKES